MGSAGSGDTWSVFLGRRVGIVGGAAVRGVRGDQPSSSGPRQWKTLTRGGAHVFYIGFQVLQATDPWKDAR
jgi:hypothetical protein